MWIIPQPISPTYEGKISMDPVLTINKNACICWRERGNEF